MSFQCKLVHPDAKVPVRAHASDAGLDVCSVEDTVIPAREQRMVSTGITISIPRDCYARVAPRSGLSLKNKIWINAGVVDSGYRNEIRVIMLNNGDEDFIIKKGDRIAQLIFERIYTDNFTIVEELDSASDRGLNGFGSTGV